MTKPEGLQIPDEAQRELDAFELAEAQYRSQQMLQHVRERYMSRHSKRGIILFLIFSVWHHAQAGYFSNWSLVLNLTVGLFVGSFLVGAPIGISTWYTQRAVTNLFFKWKIVSRLVFYLVALVGFIASLVLAYLVSQSFFNGVMWLATRF